MFIIIKNVRAPHQESRPVDEPHTFQQHQNGPARLPDVQRAAVRPPLQIPNLRQRKGHLSQVQAIDLSNLVQTTPLKTSTRSSPHAQGCDCTPLLYYLSHIQSIC